MTEDQCARTNYQTVHSSDKDICQIGQCSGVVPSFSLSLSSRDWLDIGEREKRRERERERTNLWRLIKSLVQSPLCMHFQVFRIIHYHDNTGGPFSRHRDT